jgi:hypothetical protein
VIYCCRVIALRGVARGCPFFIAPVPIPQKLQRVSIDVTFKALQSSLYFYIFICLNFRTRKNMKGIVHDYHRREL